MSGKKTYLYPHPAGYKAIEGGWVRQLPRRLDWRAIETALGRTLSADERSHIEDVAARHADFIRRNNDEAHVTAQDLKETLRGLADMPLGEVHQAYLRSDRWTRAEIDVALLPLRVTGRHATAEQIKNAAASRVNVLKVKSGRRTDTALLDSAIWTLWRDLGGRYSRPAVRGDYATPLVNFAYAVCAAAGGRAQVSKAAIATRLRKVGPGRFLNTTTL